MLTEKCLALCGLIAFVTSVNAHFQLQYPEPRGVFVEDDEPSFCDGYTNSVDNRTVFPFGQGVITLNSEHPTWTAQVLISTDQNPTNFSQFNTSGAAVPFFKASGEGLVCIAIDIENLNITGVKDGSNVTIQVQFEGGDGDLFQCADLTLSNNATTPSGVNCSNLVSNTTTSTNTTSSASSPSSTSSSGALPLLVEGSGLLGLLVATALTFL